MSSTSQLHHNIIDYIDIRCPYPLVLSVPLTRLLPVGSSWLLDHYVRNIDLGSFVFPVHSLLASRVYHQLHPSFSQAMCVICHVVRHGTDVPSGKS